MRVGSCDREKCWVLPWHFHPLPCAFSLMILLLASGHSDGDREMYDLRLHEGY